MVTRFKIWPSDIVFGSTWPRLKNWPRYCQGKDSDQVSYISRYKFDLTSGNNVFLRFHPLNKFLNACQPYLNSDYILSRLTKASSFINTWWKMWALKWQGVDDAHSTRYNKQQTKEDHINSHTAFCAQVCHSYNR